MNGMSGAIRSPPPPVAPKPAHISPRPSNDAPVSPVKPERQQSEQQNGEKVEDIDEKRLNRKAYDYLCRLSEVRNWLVECLRDDSISPATTLESALQNGVLLARIANFFAPDVVPTTAIYDLDQNKYETRLAADPENPENALVYRHTDNIVLWRKGLESIRLPEILIPETADVYEGRNAKTVFCLYALARQLHRMRRAPPIRNVAGKAIFTIG
ncbi:unnamed protein product, partial [Mesorhabditis belari]|uniref:Calponin-homology (CH) domain-containing protein n=1 Tax=Mesorhabditis belari TaxID=2138241 RepID=A0AAF3J2Z8_9BILA